MGYSAPVCRRGFFARRRDRQTGKNIIGAFSQFFSDSLSERTKFRMSAAVREGRFVWVAPVGDINAKNGHGSVIKLDPERAPLVRKGFELIEREGFQQMMSCAN